MDSLTEQELEQTADLIYNIHQLDFRKYAKSSFSRRITRIMSINVLKSKDELFNYIKNISSIDSFLEEITVNTTEMFRDPSFWVCLRDKVFPELLSHGNIRIWHAGCSSGEEAVSMQILLEEMGLRHKVTAYATDIDTAILRKAQTGIYSMKNYELNNSNYLQAGGKYSLEKYFEKSDSFSFIIKSELVNAIQYKRFDLVKEQMYTKFDLILCRNVLIYFDFSLQEHVINMFCDSLFSNGFVGIGQKETILSNENLNRLNLFNAQEKIYQLKT